MKKEIIKLIKNNQMTPKLTTWLMESFKIKPKEIEETLNSSSQIQGNKK